jgi:ornithine carbamoyltransferase
MKQVGRALPAGEHEEATGSGKAGSARPTPAPEILRTLKHFLAIRDIEPPMLQALVDFSIRRKAEFLAGQLRPMLAGKVLAMVFQKSSLRTRLGFEVAMAQLGGHAVNLEDHQVGLTKREAACDVARVIASMCNCIMARVYSHQLIVELAAASRVPVINGLSDWGHPCQALADVMTIQEHFGKVAGLKVAYIGDANNVARSLLSACVKLGARYAIASPAGYELDNGILEYYGSIAHTTRGSVVTTSDPHEAVAGADVIYTDVWTSMGQEAERIEREKTFTRYQVNAALLKRAKPTSVVMHCLPAYRNLEITDDVIDGPQSVIFQQAENRLHSQRALLEILINRNP